MSEAFPDVRPPAPLPGGRARLGDLLSGIRAGEDPLAGAAVLLVVALVAGFFWYRAGLRGGEEVAAALPAPPATVVSTTTAPALLVVHVAGAVARPGLYRLPPGSRVADAVEAAGGPVPVADLDRLNLAAPLGDGQRVAVPRRGEALLPEPAAAPGTGAEAQPVDLNTAGQAELESLPGVGPATARAILEERARRGGFRSPRDLLRVPGIGERRFAELRDRVRV